MIYIAHYTKRGDTYTITVIQAEAEAVKYRYDELVTASLDTKAVPRASGSAYWEKDGAIVSADEVYQFRAGRDEQITAVFTDGWPPAEKGPVLLMGQPTVSQSDLKFTFLSEWSLPLDYNACRNRYLGTHNEEFQPRFRFRRSVKGSVQFAGKRRPVYAHKV